MAPRGRTASKRRTTRRKPRNEGLLSDKEKARIKFQHKVNNAATEAYWAQERKTIDSDVKRAVREATLHMAGLILDQPFQVSKVTAERVQKMVLDIKGPLAVLQVEKVKSVLARYTCTRECRGATGICRDPIHELVQRLQVIVESNNPINLVSL